MQNYAFKNKNIHGYKKEDSPKERDGVKETYLATLDGPLGQMVPTQSS